MSPSGRGAVHWSEFGIRRRAPLSARTRVADAPPLLRDAVDERVVHLAVPLRGITTDGSVRPGLFRLEPTGASPAAVVEAAQSFLAALAPGQRARAQLPLDAEDWRTWINVHVNFFRHGVMLDDLPSGTRRRALELLRETLSARGYGLARDVMRINELLLELTGSPDEFGEWLYFVSIFGEPSLDEPWGWQIDGHHLCINCMMVGDQMVLTPTFMGAEPCRVHDGAHAGTQVFVAEQQAGLDLVRSLDDAQAAEAILLPSIYPEDLPTHLDHVFDGRMAAGAFHDNIVLPEQGVRATSLSDAQRRLLLDLAATYVGWASEPHAAVRMQDVVRHLDETWFAWMGATGDSGPFYYRVHSPVVLIEFDHHSGVVFDNDAPSRHHVHTVVRTPNGNDYGADLLRQHHDRYDHSQGAHAPRA